MAWLSLFLYIYTFIGKNKRLKIIDFKGVASGWQIGWLNGKSVKIISKYYIRGWRVFFWFSGKSNGFISGGKMYL
jgi:hypothetical protein